MSAAELPRAEPVARYDKVAMILHWVVAAFIILAVCAGLAAANADDADVARLTNLHKSFGLTALALILVRIYWRLRHKPPPLPRTYSQLEKKGAHFAHFLLYAVMLALPLTGYIHDSAWKLAATHPIILYGLVHFPRIGFIESMDPATKLKIHDTFSAAHTYLGYIIYGLFALHLIGVAKHQAVDHEPELQRMLPETYRRPDVAE